MNLREFRDLCLTGYDNGWRDDLSFLTDFTSQMKSELTTLRNMNMFGWPLAVLIKGPSVMDEPYAILQDIFEEQCRQEPEYITPGELTLAAHANLFACVGKPDFTFYFSDRLWAVTTRRNSRFAHTHHAKVLIGIALGRKATYRGAVGTDIGIDQAMPFTPLELHGYNPQSFLAHLAGAVETHAAIEEVWPAFKEFVFNFPGHEQTEEFDGACLFWVARIVHHQIGGQPLGETAAWLHRHFNAWADGDELPPIGT
jgi:hypothetical protein